MKKYILKMFITIFCTLLLYPLSIIAYIIYERPWLVFRLFVSPIETIYYWTQFFIFPYIKPILIFSLWYTLFFLITWFISKRFIKIIITPIFIFIWFFVEMEISLLNLILFIILNITLYIWIVFLIKNSYSLKKDL